MSLTLDTFVTPSVTQTAGTVITTLVPPWRGAGGSALPYRVVSGRPNWMAYGGAFTHIDSLIYTAGSTAHDVFLMRPLNWAVVSGDVAHNATVVTLLTDPGAYTTAGSFKYPLPADAAGIPAGVATNVIAANDYVAVQLRDGTWHLSTVASVSGLAVTLTTATPNVSGGGVEDGSILFYFGVSTDTNPNTGAAHTKLTSVASTRQELLVGGKPGPSFRSLFPGDPILIYSGNASNAAILSSVAGHYARP